MPPLHAIVLGLTQGLTEFLPVSSSGHLLLVPRLFGWNDFHGDVHIEKAFDVALHIGTTVALLAYFAKDIIPLAQALIVSILKRSVVGRRQQLAWLLVVSAVPGAATGAVLESTIERHLGSSWLIGTMLATFGLILGYADRRRGTRVIETEDEPIAQAAPAGFARRDAIVMGLAQALALSPGVSRSGATITAGRLLGFDRDAAARISFLMSVPITLGAIGFKVGKLFVLDGGIPSGLGSAFAIGIITSGISGFLAVAGLLRLIRTKSFNAFVIYRVVAGVAVIALTAAGVGTL